MNLRAVIQQTVTFKASPQELFRTYLDAKRHTAVIGHKVSISPEIGAALQKAKFPLLS